MPQKPTPLDETRSARAWWGKELRNWRTVRRLSSRALGERVQLSGTMIERIEKAERTCTAELARALDDALAAGGALTRLWRLVEEEERQQRADADKIDAASEAEGPAARSSGMLGEVPLASLDRISPVERRKFALLGGLAALAPGFVADMAQPRTVRAEDLAQVRAASHVLSRWDNAYGGEGIVRSAVEGKMAWARGLLQADCPPRMRAELLTEVGRLAIVLGASAFDRFEHDDAAILLDFGRQCAEQADNWSLRASALNWLARQSVWRGRPEEGLTHAEIGLVRADRLTPREQAMLHNARARAFAQMERPREALTAVGQSDEIFSRARPGEDAPWMAYYDLAQHYGDTGHAVYDIAVLPGQREVAEMARHRLQTAVKGHTAEYVRSRALSGTKLATLLMTKGEPETAVVVAQRALDEVGRLRSRRAAQDVASLSKAAARYARRDDVAHLRTRIATVLA